MSWPRYSDSKIWIESPAARRKSLDAPDERQLLTAHRDFYTNAMVNVCRHRLEALQRLEEKAVMGGTLVSCDHGQSYGVGLQLDANLANLTVEGSG